MAKTVEEKDEDSSQSSESNQLAIHDFEKLLILISFFYNRENHKYIKYHLLYDKLINVILLKIRQ